MTLEQRTAGGILLPPKPNLRAWLKLRNEPAQVLVETPVEFMQRRREFLQRRKDWNGDPTTEPVMIVHDHSYGQPLFLFIEQLTEVAWIGCTHPTTEQGRTTPGSIYAGTCPCGEFGGPCG